MILVKIHQILKNVTIHTDLKIIYSNPIEIPKESNNAWDLKMTVLKELNNQITSKLILVLISSAEVIDLGKDYAFTKGVSKSFKEVQAVNNISLDIGPGRIFGLLGANGAGKLPYFK